MCQDGIGVPGLNTCDRFKTKLPDVYFSLCHENEEEIHSLMRANLTGGPSIIFYRYDEKRQNQHKVEGKKVSSLEGFDANILYLRTIMQTMPTENPTISVKKKKKKKVSVLERWI